jgi:hypothetical protein
MSICISDDTPRADFGHFVSAAAPADGHFAAAKDARPLRLENIKIQM